jgi:hypothetical protein
MPDTDIPSAPPPLIEAVKQSDNIYEQMCILLYAQRLGMIDLSELFSAWEEILGLESPPPRGRYLLRGDKRSE